MNTDIAKNLVEIIQFKNELSTMIDDNDQAVPQRLSSYVDTIEFIISDSKSQHTKINITIPAGISEFKLNYLTKDQTVPYTAIIDWGDGNIEKLTSSKTPFIHQYAVSETAQTYVIDMNTAFSNIRFNNTWGSDYLQSLSYINSIEFSDKVKQNYNLNAVYEFKNSKIQNVEFLNGCTLLPQLTALNYGVFQNCTNLTSLNELSVCQNIKTVGTSAIEKTQLTSLDFLENSNITTFGGSNQFRYNYILENIDGLRNSNITTFGAGNAFECGYELTSIDGLSNSNADRLPRRFFAEARNLENINGLSNCTNLSAICAQTFYNCKKLSNADGINSNNISEIGKDAFTNTSITSIKFLRNNTTEQIKAIQGYDPDTKNPSAYYPWGLKTGTKIYCTDGQLEDAYGKYFQV